MGASGWAYFVPYQEDIKAALQQLRRDVFTKGEYVQSWSDGEYVQSWSKTEKIEKIEQELSDLQALDTEEQKKWQTLKRDYQIELAGLNAEPEPATIDEKIEALLLLEQESGTHSILDILDISSKPELFCITPLSNQELQTIFGKEKPTREMVIANEDTLMDWRGRWEGIYVIVYQNNQPHEIYFTGFSGD